MEIVRPLDETEQDLLEHAGDRLSEAEREYARAADAYDRIIEDVIGLPEDCKLIRTEDGGIAVARQRPEERDGAGPPGEVDEETGVAPEAATAGEEG